MIYFGSFSIHLKKVSMHLGKYTKMRDIIRTEHYLFHVLGNELLYRATV